MKKFFLLGLMTSGLVSFANANDLKNVNSSETNLENTVNGLEEFGHWKVIRHQDNEGNVINTSRIWVR